MEIFRAGISDYPELLHLQNAVRGPLVEVGKYPSWGIGADKDNLLKQKLGQSDVIVLVARENSRLNGKRIVGKGHINILKDKKIVELSSFDILPEAQGRNLAANFVGLVLQFVDKVYPDTEYIRIERSPETEDVRDINARGKHSKTLAERLETMEGVIVTPFENKETGEFAGKTIDIPIKLAVNLYEKYSRMGVRSNGT